MRWLGEQERARVRREIRRLEGRSRKLYLVILLLRRMKKRAERC